MKTKQQWLYKIDGVRITVKDLADRVYQEGQFLKQHFTKDELREGTEIRLQVHCDWTVHTGDSCFDQDHRGFWGASCVSWGCTRKEARDVAIELLEEAAEMEACDK